MNVRCAPAEAHVQTVANKQSATHEDISYMLYANYHCFRGTCYLHLQLVCLSTLIAMYQNVWCHNPEDNSMKPPCHENLQWYTKPCALQ